MSTDKSADLFLTTLHPLASTVTGEDINASLYYIHIHPPTSTSTSPQPAARPGSHRRWSSRSPRWHKPLPTMTLVRRDPATGSQWNVARISQLPPAPGPTPPDPADGILLELTAPGYTKFLPPERAPYYPPPPAAGGHAGGPDLAWKDFAYGSPEEERAEWEARRRAQLRAESGAAHDDDDVDGRALDEPEERVFRREMALEGVGFWSRLRGGSGGRRKPGSRDTGAEHGAGTEKAKKRGYVFEGLWGAAGTADGTGKCGFKDEAAGKFLKAHRNHHQRFRFGCGCG